MRQAEIPDWLDRFLGQPNTAVIANVRPDGFPATVVTWYDWDDGRILINMNEIRNRLRWMRTDPKVSLTVFDSDWTRHVSVRGTVVSIHEDKDLIDIDRLSRRYTGQPFADRKARRFSAWIQPVGWHVWDPAGELVPK